ncbi:hypothetical protein EJ05DRAFT_99680 [Pseudovirgaria hyperparasitica]|uniref:Uncharacterized protein n=1 Tax=Pseudovirgaria hyperparasitica TaxID=470096 RepID=A0A6A6VYM0_9PEZI|nr:uncharacterized protein EJ05DRAFT_99680 [Pseudovirgaria hyperparasitica]KAF2755373.1 hypothetical protein EJ05DRAFT_99680 [Pseudovirgaria hyperparasitica]
MSVNSKPKGVAGPKGDKPSSLSDEDAEELRKLDEAYARIRKVIPDTPYFLTVPQDEPRYHHHSRQEAEAWMSGLGTMFESHEENMQYATFIYREQGDNCFVCRTAVDEDRDRKAKAGRNAAPANKNYLGGSSNKRVSLGSYLGKSNGISKSQSQSKNSASQPKVEAKRTGSDDEPAQSFKTDSPQANGVHESSRASDKVVNHKQTKREPSPKSDPPRNGKRAFEEDENQSTDAHKPADEVRSMKRSKTSPGPDVKKPSVHMEVPSTSTPHDLPPLLSPILNKYDLPPLLSPTLPPQIQQELDKDGVHQRLRGISDASSSSESKSRIASKTVPHTVVTAPKPDSSQPETDHRSLQPAFDPTAAAAPVKLPERLVVKLRYGRKQRQMIDRILKLPSGGTPKKSDVKRDRSRDPPPSTSTSKSKNPPLKPSIDKVSKPREPHAPLKEPKSSTSATSTTRPVAEKRPRSDDTTSLPIKRHKNNSSVDLKPPQTPAQASMSPPGTSVSSTIQRPKQYLTPKKEHRPVNLARTTSDQGVDNLTPASVYLSVKGSGGRGAPSSAPQRKQPDIDAWRARSVEFGTFGKSLKREYEALAQKPNPSEEDKQWCAVRSLECILAYIAAFAAGDYGGRLQRTGLSNAWRDLLPMCERFAYATRYFPDLDALRLHLIVVVISRIVLVLSQRTDALLTDPAAPAPDSPKGILAMYKELSTHVKKQSRIALDASRALPMQKLMEQFPETWAGRERVMDPLEWEDLKPGDLGRTGPYWIHAGLETTPVQAVRFGLKFLAEWMRTKSELKSGKVKVVL